MADRYVLGPGAARQLRQLLRGSGELSRRMISPVRATDPSEFAHPYEVVWAQSINNGDGGWIIWLPPGHLFLDGKEVDITATVGGSGGMTAAGGAYPTGWFKLDLGEDYTAGSDFVLYLDVGADPPVFGIDASEMAVPVRIAKVKDEGKQVVGIVESALVIAEADPIYPYKVKWFPNSSGNGGQFGIHFAANYLMVGGNYITPTGLTQITVPDAGTWYALPSGFTSGTLYLNVRCWYYGNPIANASDSAVSAASFVRRSAINASAVLADSPVNISTDSDAAHQAVYSIVIAVVTVSQGSPPVIAQKIKSALYLEAPIPEPVRGNGVPSAVSGIGAVIDTLVISRDMGGKVGLNSVVAVKAGTGITINKISNDAAAAELGVPYIEISANGGGGSGGGGSSGGSITLTPGNGILINDSDQAQTGTSFTIKAVYV